MWQAAGHHVDDPVLTAEMRNNGQKFNACAMFLKHIAPLIQSIGMIFEAVDRPTSESYLRVFHHRLETTALDVLQPSARACVMGITVNRNNRVIPHKDVNDFKDRWAVMCCFDTFKGGELCLPKWKKKLSRESAWLTSPSY